MKVEVWSKQPRGGQCCTQELQAKEAAGGCEVTVTGQAFP